MITRRYLRIKVMQSLYGFQIKHNDSYFSEDEANGKNKRASWKLTKKELSKGQKDLLQQIQHSYNLYLYCLFILIRFWNFANKERDRIKASFNVKERDLKVADFFISNKVLQLLASHSPIVKLIEKLKVHLEHEREIVNGIYKSARESGKFDSFISQKKQTLAKDIDIVKQLFNDVIMKETEFDLAMESISLNWTSDKNLITGQVIQSLEGITSKTKKLEPYVLKDKSWDDSKEFLVNLFGSTLENRNEFDSMISKQTKNWDIKRITFIDSILMHMALSEMLYFDNIPLKVTMDEYIEIAKRYSTPKSKEFINGILDRLMRNLLDEGKIKGAKKVEMSGLKK